MLLFVCLFGSKIVPVILGSHTDALCVYVFILMTRLVLISDLTIRKKRE